jgi:hypothetical protein
MSKGRGQRQEDPASPGRLRRAGNIDQKISDCLLFTTQHVTRNPQHATRLQRFFFPTHFRGKL